MTDLQAVERRISRRAYVKSAIDGKKLSILKEYIKQVNKESHLNVAFIDDGGGAFNGITKSYGMFSGVTGLILLKGTSNDLHLHEKAGYFGERLVLEATKLDLGTCWVGGSYDKKFFEKELSSGEKIVCAITVGNVSEEKTTVEKLISKVTHRKSKQIKDLFYSDEAVPDWFIYGIRAVLRAPSAVNRQKVFFEYRDKSVTAYIDNKYELGLIDLGIAKLHFDIGAGGKFAMGNPGVFSNE